MADTTRAWALKQGFGLYAAEGARSQTLTAVANDGRTDVARLKELLGERGYAMDGGYGKIKNTTFRIPHMGDMTMADMEEYFALLEELLPQVRS
jgi:aspartate aminotransferase-like enzyme